MLFTNALCFIETSGPKKKHHFLRKKRGTTLELATSKARKETKTLFKTKSCKHCPRKNHSLSVKGWRRRSESNRRIELLQSPALPLGYSA